MCRNIKTLFNFDPPANHEEIHSAAEQFVRKISGFTKPSKINEGKFNNAIQEIEKISQTLLYSLVTEAEPKNREIEAQKAHERAIKRFGPKN